MKSYFGYIRVSTAKQGTHGVSLTEQKAAIERYASRNALSISEWFEERETAAKRGRPVFTRMLGLLRKGKATGVIIHKIDRSARNLKDWADLGDLIDAGVDVHFAADALDLNSRGGRLSADIQAVVAADYIRNLREETRKGFYGRLKQGLYPLAAPTGYLDRGGGQAKVHDPKTAPLVRKVFELYASGPYSLRSLWPEIKRLGLTSRRGGTLSRNGLAKMLRNPFYCGLIRLQTSAEMYQGAHTPLISVSLFDRVQQVLHGKAVRKVLRHDFLFRRTIRCGICGRTLTGERQKGRVYYRCHTSSCGTAIREDQVVARLRSLFMRVQLTEEEGEEVRRCLDEHARLQAAHGESKRSAINLRLSDARSRLNRLTDALIDGLLDREAFEARKSALLLDIARLEERLREGLDATTADQEKMFELASSLILSYDSADDAHKREIIEITTSNFSVSGKELAITLSEPFLTLSNRHAVSAGGPQRARVRTLSKPRHIRALVDRLLAANSPRAIDTKQAASAILQKRS